MKTHKLNRYPVGCLVIVSPRSDGMEGIYTVISVCGFTGDDYDLVKGDFRADLPSQGDIMINGQRLSVSLYG